MTDVLVPVSLGELFDKISILEIKVENITDTAKLANVNHELSRLTEISTGLELTDLEDISGLRLLLKDVNKKLWDSEDEIRELERISDFSDCFIKVARKIYKLNDERAAIKKKINFLCGSVVVEEKSYADY